MKHRHFLASVGFFLAAALAAFAAPAATVVSAKGAVQSPGQPALQPGATLAAGALIRTGGSAEVALRFFDGTVATVLADSEVTIERLEAQVEGERNVKEITVLNLQRGTVVASLDPAKKDITSFSVRTPRGVAVARGTVFAVRVTQDQANATVGTMSGVVTFVTDRGEISVAFGQASAGGSVQTVAEAVAADPTLAAVFMEAAVSVANAIGQGAITNTSGTPNLVEGVLAAVVKVAADANPGSKGELLSAVGNAVGSGNGNLVAIAAAAASDRTPAAQAGKGGDGNPNTTILPSLDQTQVVVSPSRN